MELGCSLPHSQESTTCPSPSQINPLLCPSHFSQAQLVSFLVGPRTYQHPGTHYRCREYCCNWSHLMTHPHTHTVDSSGLGIGPSQRPLPHNIQQSQRTDIHAAGGIRTRNPIKRAAENPRLSAATGIDSITFNQTGLTFLPSRGNIRWNAHATVAVHLQEFLTPEPDAGKWFAIASHPPYPGEGLNRLFRTTNHLPLSGTEHRPVLAYSIRWWRQSESEWNRDRRYYPVNPLFSNCCFPHEKIREHVKRPYVDWTTLVWNKGTSSY